MSTVSTQSGATDPIEANKEELPPPPNLFASTLDNFGDPLDQGTIGMVHSQSHSHSHTFSEETVDSGGTIDEYGYWVQGPLRKGSPGIKNGNDVIQRYLCDKT